jgi:hypothetical protein
LPATIVRPSIAVVDDERGTTNTARLVAISLVGAFLAASCALDECPEDSCYWYTSQDEAQSDLDAYPEACIDLDPNGDGGSCNEPGNGITVCATSSAFGCSSLRKVPGSVRAVEELGHSRASLFRLKPNTAS